MALRAAAPQRSHILVHTGISTIQKRALTISYCPAVLQMSHGRAVGVAGSTCMHTKVFQVVTSLSYRVDHIISYYIVCDTRCAAGAPLLLLHVLVNVICSCQMPEVLVHRNKIQISVVMPPVIDILTLYELCMVAIIIFFEGLFFFFTNGMMVQSMYQYQEPLLIVILYIYEHVCMIMYMYDVYVCEL